MPQITPEDLEEVRRLAVYGDQPQGAVTSLPAAATAQRDDAFTVDDLLALGRISEPFRMPNGKNVWVHRMTLEDVGWLNAMALKDVKRLGITDADEERTKFRHAAWIYQVISACRQGPEPNAAKTFQPDHADVLRRNLGWETIRRIVELSDRLGEGDDQLPATILDFFAHAESFLRTWSSELTADSWMECRKGLEAFASCVSVVKQQQRLGTAEVLRVAELAREAA